MMSCPHCSGPVHDLGELVAFQTTSKEVYDSAVTYGYVRDNPACKLVVRTEADVPAFVSELWRTFCCYLQAKQTSPGTWCKGNRVLTVTHDVHSLNVTYQVAGTIAETASFVVKGQVIHAPTPISTLAELENRFDTMTARFNALLDEAE